MSLSYARITGWRRYGQERRAAIQRYDDDVIRERILGKRTMPARWGTHVACCLLQQTTDHCLQSKISINRLTTTRARRSPTKAWRMSSPARSCGFNAIDCSIQPGVQATLFRGLALCHHTKGPRVSSISSLSTLRSLGAMGLWTPRWLASACMCFSVWPPPRHVSAPAIVYSLLPRQCFHHRTVHHFFYRDPRLQATHCPPTNALYDPSSQLLGHTPPLPPLLEEVGVGRDPLVSLEANERKLSCRVVL